MKKTLSTCLLSSALLCGCAGISHDHGMQDPASLIKIRTGAGVTVANNDDDMAAIHETVKKLLTQLPLTEDTAVQIALINNRELQATYNELGVAEADLVQAGRLSNPGFSFNHTRGGESAVIDRTLTFNLIDLITAPMASRIEARRFEEVKLQVADAACKVAALTRIAWVEAIAAQQNLDYAKQTSQAADASLDLADRMAKAGNWSALELEREQLFSAQEGGKMASAEAIYTQAREKLTQLLGLSGPDIQYQLPEHMASIPAHLFGAQDIEALALRDRLDIQAAKLDTSRVAAELGLTKTLRFINVLELGPALDTNNGSARAPGYQINVEIPLFDWGQARAEKAESLYMQSAHRLAAQIVNAQSQVRSAYADYQAKYEIARRFQDEIIPLQKKISAENLLRYNGMLISVFDLLADARDQIGIVNANVEALKDFWIADARLQIALGGTISQTEHSGVVQ